MDFIPQLEDVIFDIYRNIETSIYIVKIRFHLDS